MNYFEVFSFVFGLLLIGVRSLIHLMPEKWNNWELNKAYTEERPKWVWGAGLLSICLVVFTWYKEFTTDVPLSIVFTLVITLTLVKVSQVIFNYDNFRKFAKRALTEDRSLVIKINIVTTILGLILVLMGVFVY